MLRARRFACRTFLCVATVLALCLLTACAAAPEASEAEVVDVLASHTPQALATPVNCALPDLKLQTEAEARKALAACGVYNIEVEYAAVPDVPAGLVAGQSVEAGACPQAGTPVKLRVSAASQTPAPTAAPTQAAEPTPTSEPTPDPKPAPTKKPRKTDAPVIRTEAPIITPAPSAAPAGSNQSPQVTPQPTWSFDLGALYDPNSEDCG